MQDGGERSLLIITSSEVAECVVENMKENNYARFHMAGVSVIDEDWIGRTIEKSRLLQILRQHRCMSAKNGLMKY